MASKAATSRRGTGADGLDGALAEMPEDERFPSKLGGPNVGDPSPVDPDAPPSKRAADDGRKRWGVAEEDAEGGRQAEPRLADADDPDEPRDDHGRWVGGEAHLFVRHAERSTEPRRMYVLGIVESVTAQHLRALGHNAGGKAVKLDHSYVRHILLKHGTEREILRGQQPVTHGDLAATHDLLNSASSFRHGNPPIGKQGHPRFEATAYIGGCTYTIVGETRKRAVLIVNMWKR